MHSPSGSGVLECILNELIHLACTFVELLTASLSLNVAEASCIKK